MDLYCAGNLDRPFLDHLFILRVKLVLAQCEEVVVHTYIHIYSFPQFHAARLLRNMEHVKET